MIKSNAITIASCAAFGIDTVCNGNMVKFDRQNGSVRVTSLVTGKSTTLPYTKQIRARVSASMIASKLLAAMHRLR